MSYAIELKKQIIEGRKAKIKLSEHDALKATVAKGEIAKNSLAGMSFELTRGEMVDFHDLAVAEFIINKKNNTQVVDVYDISNDLVLATYAGKDDSHVIRVYRVWVNKKLQTKYDTVIDIEIPDSIRAENLAGALNISIEEPRDEIVLWEPKAGTAKTSKLLLDKAKELLVDSWSVSIHSNQEVIVTKQEDNGDFTFSLLTKTTMNNPKKLMVTKSEWPEFVTGKVTDALQEILYYLASK